MNQVIQLKQTDGYVNPNPETGDPLNGDYMVNLDQKIVVEQGDTIAIKNTFIDTEATNSAEINVPPNTTITTRNYLYVNDLITEQNLAINLDGSARTTFTGEPFIACKKLAGSGTQAGRIDTIELGINSANNLRQSGTLVYQYTDVEGNPATYTGTYTIDDTDDKPKFVPIGKEIIFIVANGITFDTSNWFRAYVALPTTVDLSFNGPNGIIDFPGPEEEVQDTFEPIILENTIAVDAGNYDPNSLITELNTKTQLNTPDSTRLLNTSYLCATNGDNPAKLITPVSTEEVTFFNAQGTDAFRLNGTVAQIYVGTDNFAFGYEEAQAQFTIDYLHFPYINNNDGTRVVGLFKKTNPNDNSAQDYFTLVSYGGIFFNNIGDNNGLLSKSMNFDLTQLSVPTTQVEFLIDTVTGKCPQTTQLVNNKHTFLPLTLSKQITGQLVTLNSFVDKRQGRNFQEIPVSTANKITQNFFAQSPDTYQILAGPSVIRKTFNFGYFLIEVEGKFPTDLLTTKNTFKFIKQIVGRYYENNSFTQGESGQIIYQHQSPEPLYLNSFRVRILNPDYTVPPGLGPNSAVFLEHIRGGVPPSKPPAK